MEQYKFIHLMWNLSNKKKYAKWYLGLTLNIANRDHRTKSQAQQTLGYIEGHHILPSSFDKSVSKHKGNILYCTAREHFLIHLLMSKMFPNSRLNGLSRSAIRAFTMNNSLQYRKITSRQFEQLRKICQERAVGNSYGAKTKGYIFYTNGKEFTTLPKGVSPPDGWWRGAPRKGITITKDGVDMKIPNGEPIPEGWCKGSKRKGKPSPLKGRKRSPTPADTDRHQKISISQKNKIWVTDGLLNLRLNQGDDIPAGWRRGRIGVKFDKTTCPVCGKNIDVGNLGRHVVNCKEDKL